jgi:peptidoglycan/LPS O-acetylase OafA/YrhL
MPQLDGVRALAVLAVVGVHADLPFTLGGGVGVDIFFVLSGFLITTILVREVNGSGRIRLGAFYARRALRLFPALILVAAVTAIVWAAFPWAPMRSDTLWGTLAAVTYTSSWVRAFDLSGLAYMGHAWSLSVEEHFYLVWPLLLLLFARTRRFRGLVLTVTAAAITYRVLADTLLDWSAERIYNGPDTRAEQLLIGCSLAVLLYRSHRRVGLGPALIAAGLLTAAVLVPIELTLIPGGSTVAGVAAAVLIAHMVTDERSWLVRLLATPPLVWVGERSYGIYLWHRPIFGLLFGAGLAAPVMAGLGLALTLIIPALSYRFVEQPFLRMKRRYETAASPQDPADIGRAA